MMSQQMSDLASPNSLETVHNYHIFIVSKNMQNGTWCRIGMNICPEHKIFVRWRKKAKHELMSSEHHTHHTANMETHPPPPTPSRVLSEFTIRGRPVYCRPGGQTRSICPLPEPCLRAAPAISCQCTSPP